MDKSMTDLSGYTCNKIGLKATTVFAQEGKCYRKLNSYVLPENFHLCYVTVVYAHEQVFPLCSKNYPQATKSMLCLISNWTHTYSMQVLLLQNLEARGIKSHFFPPFYGEFVGIQGATTGFDPLEQHALLTGNLTDPTGLYFTDKHNGLKMIYRSNQVHNSLVTLTFTAESIAFIENR